MALIISFVNQVFTPQLKMGIIDRHGKFSWFLPEILMPWESAGTSGIATYNNKLYICVQQAGLIVLDVYAQVKQEYVFKHVLDPHSLLFVDDILFVVSTGTNQIYSLEIDKNGFICEERLFWQSDSVPDCKHDYIHVNSICEKDSHFFVTEFGEKNSGESWRSTQNGRFVNISSGEVLIEGLRHPHSAFNLNGRIIICESLSGNILLENGQVICSIDGYVRGVAKYEDYLIVASSARRKISKSLKKIIPGRIGEFEDKNLNHCKLTFIDKYKFHIIDEYDISVYGNEIFDILPVSDDILNFISHESDPKESRIFSFEETFVDALHKSEQIINKSEKENLEKERIINHQYKFIEQQKIVIENRKLVIKGMEARVLDQNNKINNYLETIKNYQNNKQYLHEVIIRYRKRAEKTDNLIENREKVIFDLNKIVEKQAEKLKNREKTINNLRHNIVEIESQLYEFNSIRFLLKKLLSKIISIFVPYQNW